MIAVSNLPKEKILDSSVLQCIDGVNWVNLQNPDWMISISFRDILKPHIFNIPKFGAINLHTSLLPYNKGMNPNIWSIVDQTPAGVTLHFINDGIDTGDIISQREVFITETDTGLTLFNKLQHAAFNLFKDTFSSIYANKIKRIPQIEKGTFHKRIDTDKIDHIDPNKMYRAQDLINILRARTFPPYKGAYLDYGNKRIYLKIELEEELQEEILLK